MSRRRKQVIDSLDQIPRFESEEEEDRFWSLHRFSAELLRQGRVPPDRITALLRRARAKRAARQGEFPEPVKDR